MRAAEACTDQAAWQAAPGTQTGTQEVLTDEDSDRGVEGEVARMAAVPSSVEGTQDVADDADDLPHTDWEFVTEVVDRRVTELNGGTTECVWTRRIHGADDVRSTEGVIAQFDEDVRFLLETVKDEYPGARNLRWNWLVHYGDGRETFGDALSLELIFET